MSRSKPIPNRRLAFNQAVDVARASRSCSHSPIRQTRLAIAWRRQRQERAEWKKFRRESAMRVHAVQTGRVQVKASQIVGKGRGFKRRLAPLIDSDWAAWLPTYAYAIEHQDGVILVDTGASASLKRLPLWHPYFRFAVRFDVEPEDEVGPQLRVIGIGPADVRRIILTHLHIDHDAGLAAFPGAEVSVSPGELELASGISGRLRGYLPQRWPRRFDPTPLV